MRNLLRPKARRLRDQIKRSLQAITATFVSLSVDTLLGVIFFRHPNAVTSDLDRGTEIGIAAKLSYSSKGEGNDSSRA